MSSALHDASPLFLLYPPCFTGRDPPLEGAPQTRPPLASTPNITAHPVSQLGNLFWVSSWQAKAGPRLWVANALLPAGPKLKIYLRTSSEKRFTKQTAGGGWALWITSQGRTSYAPETPSPKQGSLLTPVCLKPLNPSQLFSLGPDHRKRAGLKGKEHFFTSITLSQPPTPTDSY